MHTHTHTNTHTWSKNRIIGEVDKTYTYNRNHWLKIKKLFKKLIQKEGVN